MSRLSYCSLAMLGLAASAASVSGAAVVEPRAPSQVRRDEHMALKPRQTQAVGSPLYLSEPSCNSYQCASIYHPGDTMTANWLSAPSGDVSLDLLDNAKGQAVAYNVAKVPGVSQPGYCDAGFGVGVAVAGTTCGSFAWIVPSSWALGNYTLRASSVNDPSIESYTDTILIQANPDAAKASSSFAFATAVISGAPSSTATVGTAPFTTTATTAPVSPGAPQPTGANAAASPSSSGASPSSSGAPSSSAASGSSSRPTSSGPAPTSGANANGAAVKASSSLLVGFVGAVAMGVAVLL